MRRARSGHVLIERDRITSWLRSSADFHVRAICAPIGSGKTVAARQYAALFPDTVAHRHIREGLTSDGLSALLASASGEPKEIILDGLDRAEPSAIRDFMELVAQESLPQHFLILARSRSLLGIQSLVSRGSATLLGPLALNFTAEEIASLASMIGVAHDADDLAQFVHDTDGWAIAADWILRDAAQDGHPLRGALEEWNERCGHVFLEFINGEGGGQVDTLTEFDTYYRHGWIDIQQSLNHLESLGYPVVRSRNLLRPFRLLTRLIGAPSAEMSTETQPEPVLSLKTLGRFRCSVGAHKVPFQRKRERNIFAFVAIAPEGRAHRQQILDAFWPDASRAIATQGLRTALSRIRVALARVVGTDAVDQYFSSDRNVIRVNQARVVVDVSRFVEHVSCGRVEDARGATISALHHYLAAERLYENRLFDSESIERCFLAQADELERMYAATLARLAELDSDHGRCDRTGSYARRLIARSKSDDLGKGSSNVPGPNELVTV